VVVDDYLQQVNEIVRGCDLLSATPKQIYLHQLLGYPMPRYLHVPVLVDAQGYKLSKQTLATAVDTRHPTAVLFTLLALLQQQPPVALQQASVTEVLAWAIAHWQPERLRNQQSLGV
jgi:glutamyl-Q tRNA(Asp) synthetase